VPFVFFIPLKDVSMQFLQVIRECLYFTYALQITSRNNVLSDPKDLFVPTTKIHSYDIWGSVSKNFYIQKSDTEI